MNSLNKIQPLTATQNKLVAENVTFAMNIGKKYAPLALAKGLECEDLQQEACLGLIEAAQRFDLERDVAFQTYAYTWCMKYVRNALERLSIASGADVAVVRLNEDIPDLESVRQAEASAKVENLLGMLTDRERQIVSMHYGIGCDPLTIKQIAQELNLRLYRTQDTFDRAIAKMTIGAEAPRIYTWGTMTKLKRMLNKHS